MTAALEYLVLAVGLVALGFYAERRPQVVRRLFWPATIVGFGVGMAFFAIYGPSLPGGAGFDIYAYWNVQPDPYASSFGQITQLGAFRYAPPVALAIMPLHALPFWLVADAFTVLLFAALVYCAGRWSVAALAFIAVPISIYEGNLEMLLAAAIVLSARWPAAWSFPLLTKVTPGVGLVWYVARREWRPLATVLGVTAAICLPTIVLRPDLWASWLRVLADNAAYPDYNVVPLPIRVAAAAILVWFAARTDRRWLLALGVAFAEPTTVLRTLAVAVAALHPAPSAAATALRPQAVTDPAPR